MRQLNYIKILLLIFASGVVFLNLEGSKRILTAYQLLENSTSKEWEHVLAASGKKERQSFLECCVAIEVEREIENFEKRRQKRIKQLKDALKLNPYDWRIMLELAQLYKNEGNLKMARAWKKEAENLVSKKLVTSFLNQP